MFAVAIVFVVCMIGKDVSYAPFPYALRATAQVLCFGVGLFALAPALSAKLVPRYWPVAGYLFFLIVTAPLAVFPVFVLLQVLSLPSAVIFATAYFETSREARLQNLHRLVACIVITYGVFAVVSVAFTQLLPGVAYESMFAGNESSNEIRFRGVFSKSSVMAAAAGLLLGLAVIRVKSLPLKLMFAIPAMLCLALTQSRSFWVAAFAAGVSTGWIYYRSLRKWVLAACVAGVLGFGALMAFNISIDASGVSSFARLGTVSDLTGRTELWQSAFRGWSERPWLGYGFTLGGLGLRGEGTIAGDFDPTEVSRQTLHNGYLQSVMDAGLCGFFFYLMTVLVSIWRIFRNDSRRQFPEVFYVLIFLSIANFGESVIYSGSVFQSLSFWVFAIFALGIRAADGGTVREGSRALAMHPGRRAAVPPPNLLR